MYKKINILKRMFALVGLCICFSCCDFDEMNRNPYQPDDKDLLPDNYGLGLFFQQMQNFVIPVVQNQYQLCENLVGDVYGRYMAPTNDAWNEQNYAMFNAPISWLNATFNTTFPNIYGPWFKINQLTNGKGHQYAWAQILRVASMQRMTDKYGPIPYSHIQGGSITVPYDTQEEVYKAMFNDLSEAIAILTTFLESSPGSKPFARYDLVYAGDYAKWIKFANSLKLRMAMRIVYADQNLAKKMAEEAVEHPFGLIEEVTDNANLTTKWNPLYVMWAPYTDTRACADITSYMNGYEDPRGGKYFQISSFPNGRYDGLRSGINIKNKKWALEYSAPNIQENDFFLLWMNAAEVAFLRSEGALRGWNMKGTAEEFYRKGITTSFQQWGVDGAEAYLANAVNKPAAYVDPNKTYGNAAISSITIKWDNADAFERKLERIITQKWIAMWPLGQEAWSENRRTGYPKFMPVKINNGGDASLTNGLARRIPYAPTELDNNYDNYIEAVKLLGGEDNYSTKLWWDKK